MELLVSMDIYTSVQETSRQVQDTHLSIFLFLAEFQWVGWIQSLNKAGGDKK